MNPGSRSQTHVQTFATKFWHVQTFQTKIRHVQTLATKTWHFQTFATMMIRCDYRDRSGGGATKTSRLIFTNSLRPRWIRRDSGNGATQKATARPAWPARSNIHFQHFRDRGGDGATFQTEVETARPRIISRPNFGMFRLSQPTARLLSRLSRLKLSAQLCNLGLNPDVARPLKSEHKSGTSTRAQCRSLFAYKFYVSSLSLNSFIGIRTIFIFKRFELMKITSWEKPHCMFFAEH